MSWGFEYVQNSQVSQLACCRSLDFFFLRQSDNAPLVSNIKEAIWCPKGETWLWLDWQCFKFVQPVTLIVTHENLFLNSIQPQQNLLLAQNPWFFFFFISSTCWTKHVLKKAGSLKKASPFESAQHSVANESISIEAKPRCKLNTPMMPGHYAGTQCTCLLSLRSAHASQQ